MAEIVRLGWQKDTPPRDRVVEVWNVNSIILAVWDGRSWKTTEGAPLMGVVYWRWRQ